MKINDTATRPFSCKMVWLTENNFENVVYSETNQDIHKNEIKRFSNIYEIDIAEQFKDMQKRIMSKEIPVLTKLLSETSFETGYESVAERYFNQLWTEYGIIADTILQNIYLQNMYTNHFLLKHLLFIVGNMPESRRGNLEIIPLAGISNPDIEIQDLSVKCFEAWEDKRHIPTLISLRDKTNVQWFRDYINDVIEALDEE
nr:hypothetical protein [uncultured Acetatifactor sp.]